MSVTTLPRSYFLRLPPHVANEYQRDPRGLARLALSESPFGCSPSATAAARAQLQSLNRYPDASTSELRHALARHHGVAPDALIVGNGADEILLMAAHAFADVRRVGMCNQRTYPGHHASLALACSSVLSLPLRDDRVDVNEFAARASGASIAIVCNPHNPSGTLVEAEAIQALAATCREAGCVLVLDEAYVEYTDDGGHASLVQAAAGGVVLVRTFSKAYGLAGLRCGYAIGSAGLIARMSTTRHAAPFSVNRMALAAARAALEDQRHVSDVVARTRAVRQSIADHLAARGVEVTDSHANFLLADVGDRAERIARRLRDDYAIHVRPCEPFGFPGRLRLSVCTEEQLPRLLDALDRTLRS